MRKDIRVFEKVLEYPADYNRLILSEGEFGPVTAAGVTFQGICIDARASLVTDLIEQRFPALTPTTTFFRRSPLGQIEPNYVHSDEGMGDWTGILYLSEYPAAYDGTLFWTHKATGKIEGGREFCADWPDIAKWQLTYRVGAIFNRLLLFKSSLFHSRSIFENYGQGFDARLIQVVFGTGDITAIP